MLGIHIPHCMLAFQPHDFPDLLVFIPREAEHAVKILCDVGSTSTLGNDTNTTPDDPRKDNLRYAFLVAESNMLDLNHSRRG